MLKTSFQPAGTLPATVVNNSKVIGSGDRNDGKLAKSDFINPMRRAEKPSFLTLDTRQCWNRL